MDRPKSPSELADDLEEAAAIKERMTELLRELEEQVTGQPVDKPGSWRHHPADWAARHPDTNEPT